MPGDPSGDVVAKPGKRKNNGVVCNSSSIQSSNSKFKEACSEVEERELPSSRSVLREQWNNECR